MERISVRIANYALAPATVL